MRRRAPFLIAAAASLALAAPAPAQMPKRGGTLEFAISAETPTYDCHASDTYATSASTKSRWPSAFSLR